MTESSARGERRRIPLSQPSAEPHMCTPDVRREMLRRTPLFSSLSPEELVEVDRRCHPQGFVAGEAIYHRGARASRLYVVASGWVKVVVPAADGRETLLHVCGPGDPLGALPALGEERHVDSAWALSPSCLLGLDAQEYDQIMEDFPAVALATVKGVSRRLRESRNSVHLLSGAPLPQRLAATLVLLAEAAGREWEGGILIDVPLSREDLASMTGAATESVSRVLSDWKRAGLIDSGRRWVALMDVEAVRALRRG